MILGWSYGTPADVWGLGPTVAVMILGWSYGTPADVWGLGASP